MKCPHCGDAYHNNSATQAIGNDKDGRWLLEHEICPSCTRLIIYLLRWRGGSFDGRTLVRPKGTTRPPVPAEVPTEFADDYSEACLVLGDSPKASAALSRRCLQHLLREKAGVKNASLANEIEQVLEKNLLPSYLADDVDAVRNIGNFAAHPIKSKNTGEVLPVEPGEAEWNLDVIESLFDFYFVLPAQATAIPSPSLTPLSFMYMSLRFGILPLYTNCSRHVTKCQVVSLKLVRQFQKPC